MNRDDWDTRQYLRENTGIIGNASRTFGRQREYMGMDRAGGLTGGSSSRAMSRNYTNAPAGLKPWTSEFQFDKPSFNLNTATAAGVAPDFYRKGPQEVRINSGIIGGAIAALGGKVADRIKNKDRGEEEPSAEEEADPERPALGPGPERPALGPGPERPGPERPGPERPGPERPGPERPALGPGFGRPALGPGNAGADDDVLVPDEVFSPGERPAIGSGPRRLELPITSPPGTRSSRRPFDLKDSPGYNRIDFGL